MTYNQALIRDAVEVCRPANRVDFLELEQKGPVLEGVQSLAEAPAIETSPVEPLTRPR
jgi:hypothetical protein